MSEEPGEKTDEAQILAEQEDGRAQRTDRPDTRAGDRQGWNKGLTSKERERPGAQLLAWLIRTANDRGQAMKELAEHLGVTYGYLRQLRTGDRKTHKISDEFIDAATEYLGVPRISVLMAAGIVTPGDFRQVESWEHELDRALSYLESDPVWGAMTPASLRECDQGVQQLVVALYEQVEGKSVLGEKVDLQELVGKYEGSGDAS